MDDNAEWGPWIEHCGTYRPVNKGQYVHMLGEFKDGVRSDYIGPVVTDAYAWYWFNWSYSCARCTHYRIRKPRGLTILEGLLEHLPDEVDA